MKTLAIIVIVLGVVALPTPAPGWLIIAAGVRLLRATAASQECPLAAACNLFETY